MLRESRGGVRGMLAAILPFPRRPQAGPWRQEDLAECFRIVDLLARNGLPVTFQAGCSDEGDPWGVVLRSDSGDVLLHIARVDGQYVVASAAGPAVSRGGTLRAVLDAALASDMFHAGARARAANGPAIVRLHPAAVFASLIAAAWLHSETSSRAETGAEAGSAAEGRTQRGAVSADGSLPPSPHLLMAAVAVAAVLAVAKGASHAWQIAEMDLDALMAGAGEIPEFVGGAASGASLAHAQVGAETLPALDFKADARISMHPQDGASRLEAPTSEGAPHEAEVGSAWALPTVSVIELQHPGNLPSPQTAPISLDGGSALPVTVGETLDVLFPSASSAESHPVRSSQSSPSPSVPAAALAAATPTANAAPLAALGPAAQPLPKRAPHTEAPPQGAGEAVVAFALATDAAGAAMAGAELSHAHVQGREVALFYRGTAELLNLSRIATFSPFGNEPARAEGEARKSQSEAPLVVFSAPMVADPSAPVAKDVPTVSMAAATPSLEPTPSAPNAVATVSPTAAPAPRPMNGELLLEFTTRETTAIKGPEHAWTALAQAASQSEAVSKIVVFDAPWLAGRAFMLMPGVAMVEDDLLDGSTRATLLESTESITLDIGSGLSIRLVGVLDA